MRNSPLEEINCPPNALHLKKERSSAYFRNEKVSLKERMEANG